MKAATFPFDGLELTVAEIRKLHPRYNDTFVRKALRDGAKSSDDLLAHWHASQARYSASHKRGSINSPWRNGFTTPLSPRAT